MKIEGGQTHVIDAIVEGQVMGPPNRFKLSFQAMVARLFGEDVAIAVEERLAKEQPL